MGVRSLDALAVDEGVALARRGQPGADVEQGRFAAAARPDQRYHFAIADRDADAGYRGEGPGALREPHRDVAVFEADQVRHRMVSTANVARLLACIWPRSCIFQAMNSSIVSNQSAKCPSAGAHRRCGI